MKKLSIFLTASIIMTAVNYSYAIYNNDTQYAVPEGLYHVDISEQEYNTIINYFPEKGDINPAYINPAVDPNLHFVGTGKVSVTFIDENSQYLNKFGYFTYDDKGNILTKATIFENASGADLSGPQSGGGILKTGDTLDIGTFTAGTNVGFWLQANGFKNSDAVTYYTLDQYNPKEIRQVATVDENGYIAMGYEDKMGFGSRDYNDIIFKISVSPNDAISRNNIPGGPAPGPIATVVLGSIVTGFFALRRKFKAGN